MDRRGRAGISGKRDTNCILWPSANERIIFYSQLIRCNFILPPQLCRLQRNKNVSFSGEAEAQEVKVVQIQEFKEGAAGERDKHKHPAGGGRGTGELALGPVEAVRPEGRAEVVDAAGGQVLAGQAQLDQASRRLWRGDGQAEGQPADYSTAGRYFERSGK